MTTGELFPDDELRVAPTTDGDLTAGERLRRRQAAMIANGYHPLALSVPHLRLHPDAPRAQDKVAAAEAGEHPTCGSCRFRRLWGGHARDFPKCEAGRVDTPITDDMRARYPYTYGQAKPGAVERHYPRATHGAQTDVRAWWPGCVDHQPKDPT